MNLTREMEADVVCGVEGFPWIEGVYAFPSTAETSGKSDAFAFAIILAPYAVNELVQTHYAVLHATGAHEVAGRVLYVNAALLATTAEEARPSRAVPPGMLGSLDAGAAGRGGGRVASGVHNARRGDSTHLGRGGRSWRRFPKRDERR